MPMCCAIRFASPSSPVSYTHLDVYKRQGKLKERVSAYIKEHPGGLLLLLAAFLLLVVLQSCMSSLVTVGNGVAGAIGASTYAAEDADLLGAEAAY